jgi:predicted deacetylase
MIAVPAQYLLRIDDLCPTVSAERWLQFRGLIEEFSLKPILAVVPENWDPDLEVSLPDPRFWEQMRALESAGAAIGLHGYRHLCVNSGRSLLGLHRTSEFAGATAEMQRTWIRVGLHILRGHGLSPRIWVAPRHGFDAQTLAALRAEEIHLLSDGFARVPFLRSEITWIPQQLWSPVEKHRGLWTICVHPNTIKDEEIARLRTFLRAHASEFSSVDHLLAKVPAPTLTLAERAYADVALARVKASRTLRRIPRIALRSSNPV